MTQIAHPHPHMPTLAGHEHRRLIVGGLVALAALVAVAVVIAIAGNGGGGGGGGAVSTTEVGTGFAGAPTAGMPYAVSQAFRAELRPGTSLTTNVPALPRYEAGPVAGTAAAVKAATGAAVVDSFSGQQSLTTNVYPKVVPDAGPTQAAPNAVSEALSGR